MCPLYEREQREYQNNVERWEVDPGTGRIGKHLAVKAFHRPAAGNEQALPSDVRPPRVLIKTLDYLVQNLVDGGEPLELTHGFIRDRTRSIRQDFTLQNSRGIEAVECHERIARFHIISLHLMCEVDGFSEQQEMEQLRKALQSLAEYYDDSRQDGFQSKYEAEFRAYHVLTRLRDPDVLRHTQTLPRQIQSADVMKLAMRLYTLAQRSNEEVGRFRPPNCEGSLNFYTRFFKLVRQPSTSYIMACLCETQFNDIRKGALKSMRKSFLGAHKGPTLKELLVLLGFDNETEVEEHCELYGIVVRADEEGTMRAELNKSTYFDESGSTPRQKSSKTIVEAKRPEARLHLLINGNDSASDGPGTRNVVASDAYPRKSSEATKNVSFSNPMDQKNTKSAESQPSDHLHKHLALSTASSVPFNLECAPPIQKEFANADHSGTTRSGASHTHVYSANVDPLRTEAEESLLNEVTGMTLEAFLIEQVASFVHDYYTELAEQKAARKRLMDDLSLDLSRNLVRDRMIRVVHRVYAENCYKNNLMRRTWKLVATACHHVLARRKQRQEKMRLARHKLREYEDAFRTMNLGRHSTSRKRRRSELFEGRLVSQEVILDANATAQRFWKPVDLDALAESFHVLHESLPWCLLAYTKAHSSPGHIWLKRKLGLDSDQLVRQTTIHEVPVELHVSHSYPQESLQVGAIMFECLKTDNYDTDRERLLGLLQAVADHSNRCFPLLLLYFGRTNTDTLWQALMIPEILDDQKSPVTSCEIVCIDKLEDSTKFESCLKRMFMNTSARESPLAIERKALLEMESRSSDARAIDVLPTPRKLAFNRNSFYDTTVRAFQKTSPLQTQYKENLPPQVDHLKQSIALARSLLAHKECTE